MSDNYHLSSNENQHQHPQEFYPLLAQPSTESPSTTASPISPMTTIVHQNQSWPSIGQAIDQRHYYYDMNQHPQQQHQLQDQYWPNAYQPDPSYPHYSQPHSHQQRFQQYYSEPTYAPPPPPPPPSTHHYQHLPSSTATPVPAFYTTQQPMDNSFNAPMSNIESTFNGPSSTMAAPSIDRMQPIQHNMKEKTRQIQQHNNERLTTSPSPSETPMPSPIISAKRKRRGSAATTSQIQRKKRIQNDAKDTSKEEGDSHGSRDEADGDNGVTTTTTTTRRVDATKDTHSNQTVDQLENELAFLRDECATILIMLDSLRNAFLADVPFTTTSTLAAKSNSSSTTINFMIENVGTLSPTTTSPMQHHVDTSSATTNNGDKRRRSKAMAQNAEMEREMRFAYDDLMLQVRQLEKKVERLEGKSKHVCLEDLSMNNNKRKHEDQMANLNDDIHESQQEDTNNDNGEDKTDDDGDSGEENSSNSKGK